MLLGYIAESTGRRKVADGVTWSLAQYIISYTYQSIFLAKHLTILADESLQDLTGRHVVIVEDIVDSGFTMAHMIEELKKKNPASIEICSLLVKPGNLKVDLDINYAVMEIPNDFIVGYGLDYDQEGRNLRDIYTIVEE